MNTGENHLYIDKKILLMHLNGILKHINKNQHSILFYLLNMARYELELIINKNEIDPFRRRIKKYKN
ncbi:hypothetical protein [Ochrobactrum sp. SFR4]|uniref:hypothetical protein n=1 Tax=Ochrobactrum sp. SFR4 TaxID=2717368 RepID=UPI001C8BFC13|nr:hypothetical protein [Ochrobactrum sp. SFR4]MBX8827385.1 hypothetical protein [Ochrobactrum sp. SFR4]